jgi:hypothetical protein
MGWLREITRFTQACVGVCVVVLGVAALDYAHLEDRVRPVPPANCGNSDSCNEARNAQIAARLQLSTNLEQQYQSRAWLYAFTIVAAIAVAAAVALRSRRRVGWQRIFTNLGVGGVWSGIAATVLLVISDGDPISLPAGPLYTPAVLMIAAAAAGTVMGRREGWGDSDAVAEARAGAAAVGKSVGKWALRPLLEGSRREAAADFFSNWAIAFSATTVFLALVFIPSQPGCGGGGGEPPAWTDAVEALAGIASIGAIAAGIAALLLRRWVPALISLVASPVALLFMVAATCAFY